MRITGHNFNLIRTGCRFNEKSGMVRDFSYIGVVDDGHYLPNYYRWNWPIEINIPCGLKLLIEI